MKKELLNWNKIGLVAILISIVFLISSCDPEERDVCNQNMYDCVVGSILCADGTVLSVDKWKESGKCAVGVVFYIDESGCHGWAIGLKDLGNFVWSPQNSNIFSLSDYDEENAMSDFDGYENTRIIRSAGNSSKYPAAYSVNFNNGWYLPACGQLNELMKNICVVNASLSTIHASGVYTQALNSAGACWWSSSESSSSRAWYVKSNGVKNNGLKNVDLIVRDVRDF